VPAIEIQYTCYSLDYAIMQADSMYRTASRFGNYGSLKRSITSSQIGGMSKAKPVTPGIAAAWPLNLVEKRLIQDMLLSSGNKALHIESGSIQAWPLSPFMVISSS
jgi:hypothetical protein